jgi:predicted MFS family arabinose efflux permease
VIKLYRDAFEGLSKPVWALASVMLINRVGTMVLPFLSIYLTDALGYDLKQAGIILSLFGLGSMGGSFLGGWLTDRFGHFVVQTGSLILGGLIFISLSGVTQFEALALGVFFLSFVSEALRPANATSITFYSAPQNVPRAFSLLRMAINLGFSIGPAIGGLLAAISFRWLFIADGATCILAGLFFYLYFRNRRGQRPKVDKNEAEKLSTKSPYRDLNYIAFCMLTGLFAMVFFQLFIGLPLYYREVYSLSEQNIGGLMALNGIVVFTLEMIIVYYLGKSLRLQKIVAYGIVLTGLAFVMLNFSTGSPILYFSMLILSVAEIVAMPFMVTYVSQISEERNRGSYMGMFTWAYALAHTIAPFYGTKIIDSLGYANLWWISGITMVITAFGFYYNMMSRSQK